MTTTQSPPELRRISRRAAAVAPSATLAVDAKAKALQAAGEHVIGFGAGEPDFPTPAHIVEAAVAACRDPANHRYTPDGGDPGAARGDRRQDPARLRLRGCGQSGARHQRRASRPWPTRSPCCATPATRSWCSPPTGRPTPSPSPWPVATPVVVSSDETTGFRSSVEDLEAAWTPNTKALLFVSPSNPTGAVYPRARDRGHRPLGGVQGDLGADRRDLRASRLRRSRAPLHARGRARAGRPLPRGQRRGQDLRHDRMAGRVAHRPDRRHRGGHQHPEPRDFQRRQRVPARRAGRRVAATSTTSP